MAQVKLAGFSMNLSMPTVNTPHVWLQFFFLLVRTIYGAHPDPPSEHTHTPQHSNWTTYTFYLLGLFFILRIVL